MKTAAEKEYGNVLNDCRNLLKMIAKTLDKDAARDEKNGIRWVDTETLQHTRHQLKETLVFLSRSTDEDEAYKSIETELEKAR